MPETALKLRNDLVSSTGTSILPDNDNATPSTTIRNPLVYAAAQQLINHFKNVQGGNDALMIEAFDVPHKALVTIAEQLDELGTSKVIRETLLGALKEYVMSKGGNFSRTVNAKPVYIALRVADRKPDFKFEKGVTEMAAIDGASALVEGASNVNLRITVTGTAMTSNVADVNKIFASVRGDKLWIQFEAPTKEELAGVMNQQQMVLTAIGETIGGGIGAGELKALIKDMETQRLMTPELLAMLNNMIELRAMAEGPLNQDSKQKIGELSDKIKEQLTQGLAQNEIPLSLAKGVIESVSMMANDYSIETIKLEQFHDLKVQVQSNQIVENIVALTDHLDPVADAKQIAEITEIAQSLKDAAPAQFQEILAKLPELLPVTAELQTQVAQILTQSETLHADLAAKNPPVVLTEQQLATANDILLVLQDIDKAPDIHPELKAILAALKESGVDLSKIEASELATKLFSEKSSPEKTALLEAVVLMKTPEVQVTLPQATLNDVNVLLRDNPQIVEQAAVHVIVKEFDTALKSPDITPQQVEIIKETIQKLESGGLTAVSAKELTEIVETLKVPELAKVSQTANAIQADNVVLSNETLAKVELIAADLTTLRNELTAIKDITPEKAELLKNVESALETLKTEPAGIKSLATLTTLTQTLAANDTKLPSVESTPRNLDSLTQTIKDLQGVQGEALAIKLNVEPSVVKDSAEIASLLVKHEATLKDMGVDVAPLAAAILADPKKAITPENMEAIKVILNDPKIAPDVKAAASPEIAAKILSPDNGPVAAEKPLTLAQAVATVTAIAKSEGVVINNTPVVLSGETPKMVESLVNDLTVLRNQISDIKNPSPENVETLKTIDKAIENAKAQPGDAKAAADIASIAEKIGSGELRIPDTKDFKDQAESIVRNGAEIKTALDKETTTPASDAAPVAANISNPAATETLQKAQEVVNKLTELQDAIILDKTQDNAPALQAIDLAIKHIKDNPTDPKAVEMLDAATKMLEDKDFKFAPSEQKLVDALKQSGADLATSVAQTASTPRDAATDINQTSELLTKKPETVTPTDASNTPKPVTDSQEKLSDAKISPVAPAPENPSPTTSNETVVAGPHKLEGLAVAEKAVDAGTPSETVVVQLSSSNPDLKINTPEINGAANAGPVVGEEKVTPVTTAPDNKVPEARQETNSAEPKPAGPVAAGSASEIAIANEAVSVQPSVTPNRPADVIGGSKAELAVGEQVKLADTDRSSKLAAPDNAVAEARQETVSTEPRLVAPAVAEITGETAALKEPATLSPSAAPDHRAELSDANAAPKTNPAVGEQTKLSEEKIVPVVSGAEDKIVEARNEPVSAEPAKPVNALVAERSNDVAAPNEPAAAQSFVAPDHKIEPAAVNGGQKAEPVVKEQTKLSDANSTPATVGAENGALNTRSEVLSAEPPKPAAAIVAERSNDIATPSEVIAQPSIRPDHRVEPVAVDAAPKTNHVTGEQTKLSDANIVTAAPEKTVTDNRSEPLSTQPRPTGPAVVAEILTASNEPQTRQPSAGSNYKADSDFKGSAQTGIVIGEQPAASRLAPSEENRNAQPKMMAVDTAVSTAVSSVVANKPVTQAAPITQNIANSNQNAPTSRDIIVVPVSNAKQFRAVLSEIKEANAQLVPAIKQMEKDLKVGKAVNYETLNEVVKTAGKDAANKIGQYVGMPESRPMPGAAPNPQQFLKPDDGKKGPPEKGPAKPAEQESKATPEKEEKPKTKCETACDGTCCDKFKRAAENIGPDLKPLVQEVAKPTHTQTAETVSFDNFDLKIPEPEKPKQEEEKPKTKCETACDGTCCDKFKRAAENMGPEAKPLIQEVAKPTHTQTAETVSFDDFDLGGGNFGTADNTKVESTFTQATQNTVRGAAVAVDENIRSIGSSPMDGPKMAA